MEKDKGLVSNLMHGVAGGGHAYPYPPQQGYYPPPPTAYPPPAGYAAPYQGYGAMVEEGTWLRCLERVQPSPPRHTVHTSFLPMAAMEATVTVTAVTMAVAASLAAITMATAAITANTMEAITDTTTTMAASMAVITDTTATTAASMAVTTAVIMVATMATINTALSFSPCLLNNDTQGSPAVGMSGSLPAERHRSGVAEAMCRLASGVRMVVLDWETYHGGRVVRVPSESLAQCFIGPTVATVSGVWKKLLRSDEESTLMVLTQRMKEMVARLKPTRTGRED
uniref:Uncharacterized protein n=1 Tax=Oryza barthii TaxID=65489 RepID=A0A0D3G2L5_9ORYZ